jgi:hypothetical protein
MLSATGSHIGHACDILALLDAVLLTKEISIIHCGSHQKEAKGTKGR